MNGKRIFLIIIILGVLAFLFVTLNNDSDVTLGNYNRIQVGMSYTEVRNIFGTTHDESYSASVGNWDYDYYIWYSNPLLGSYANIGFYDGEVIVKTQVGLE